MATLPGSGYLSTGTRTEAEMKVALEQLHDVIAEIGSKAPTILTISGNTISTAPLASMILVRSEGHATSAPDSLDYIETTNITQGRLVILKNNDGTSTTSSGQTITINHGVSAGNVTLTEGTGTFVLCAQRMLAVIYSGDRWIEVWRSYGRANSEDQLDERTSLGLGTASVEAIATGSGASANSTVLKVAAGANIATNGLLAIDASGNIIAGSVTGGNADTLDNLDSLQFVRTAAGLAQSIDANLTSTTAGATRIVTDTTGVSQTAGFSMQDGGIERGLLYLDTSDGDVYLKTSDASSAPQAAIKIDAATGKLEYSSQLGTDPLQSLTPGAGNGLNADLLDGNEWADIPLYVLPTVRKITFVTNAMNNWSPDLSPIPDLTNIEYPMAPNGLRRFLVTAHVRFQTGSGFELNRQVGLLLYSTEDYLVSTGTSFQSEYSDDIENWSTGSRGELAIQDKIVTPAVGERITAVMHEISANNQSDLLADSGSGPMFNYVYTRPPAHAGTFNTYGSSRCYLCVEYLDEG